SCRGTYADVRKRGHGKKIQTQRGADGASRGRLQAFATRMPTRGVRYACSPGGSCHTVCRRSLSDAPVRLRRDDAAMTDVNGSGAGTGAEVAILAGGCFWCLEAVYDELAGVRGVKSGYIGGTVARPTYEHV